MQFFLYFLLAKGSCHYLERRFENTQTTFKSLGILKFVKGLQNHIGLWVPFHTYAKFVKHGATFSRLISATDVYETET